MFINEHFCYDYKFGIITNSLGIVRDITFYNKDFLNAHPDIVVAMKFVCPKMKWEYNPADKSKRGFVTVIIHVPLLPADA